MKNNKLSERDFIDFVKKCLTEYNANIPFAASNFGALNDLNDYINVLHQDAIDDEMNHNFNVKLATHKALEELFPKEYPQIKVLLAALNSKKISNLN